MRQHDLRGCETNIRMAMQGLDRADIGAGEHVDRLACRRAIIHLQLEQLADEVRGLTLAVEHEALQRAVAKERADDVERRAAELAALDAGIDPGA